MNELPLEESGDLTWAISVITPLVLSVNPTTTRIANIQNLASLFRNNRYGWTMHNATIHSDMTQGLVDNHSFRFTEWHFASPKKKCIKK